MRFFGQKTRYLLGFQGDELETVTLLNPNYDKTYKDEKMTIFDIKTITKNGVIFDMELQKSKVDKMAERIIFYTSRKIRVNWNYKKQ